MVSERVVGGLIFGAFIVILVLFTALLWYPPLNPYSIVAMKVIDWVLIVGVSAIAIWLGWVMISTKPIVPEEKPPQPETPTTTTTATSQGVSNESATSDAKTGQPLDRSKGRKAPDGES